MGEKEPGKTGHSPPTPHWKDERKPKAKPMAPILEMQNKRLAKDKTRQDARATRLAAVLPRPLLVMVHPDVPS